MLRFMAVYIRSEHDRYGKTISYGAYCTRCHWELGGLADKFEAWRAAAVHALPMNIVLTDTENNQGLSRGDWDLRTPSANLQMMIESAKRQGIEVCRERSEHE